MDEKNVHVRLNPNESLKLEKSLLNSQMDMIQMMKTKKRYQLLRKEEIKLKIQMRKVLKEINSNIIYINKIWPKPEMPKVLKTVKEERGRSEERHDDIDLETQLEEIKRKLESLS